ncbi:MAG: choice-of-anchor tandem repeat GloVer-containing protein [Candidatus Tumulicola sp.]
MRLTLGLVLASTCVLAACGGAHSSAGDTIAGGALPSFDNRTKPAAAGQTIYEFQGPPTDGGSPFGNLLLGSDGNFYGTTNSGGVGPRFRDGGTVFEVSPTTIQPIGILFRTITYYT